MDKFPAQCAICGRRGAAHLILLLTGLIGAGPVVAKPSTLQSATPQAAGIEVLWWWMFYGSAIIFIAVIGLLGFGLWRARRGHTQTLGNRASRNLVLTAGVAIPLLTVLALVGGSLMLGRSFAEQPPPNAINIRVTGWMWWWEIEYLDDTGRVIATTANEMHVPVGRAVALQLESRDVIHSFWVPQLHGKTDMVPGKTNRSWFIVDEPGEYRGQCAEFCGEQHSLMAFLTIAEPEAQFQQWLSQQAKTAQAPESSATRRGQDVFLQSSCGNCHTIRGTSADGQDGPDLTHFASRKSLAAVTRPNTRGHLAGWISDPQGIKPGNLMPPSVLESQELLDLVTYLESLL